MYPHWDCTMLWPASRRIQTLHRKFGVKDTREGVSVPSGKAQSTNIFGIEITQNTKNHRGRARGFGKPPGFRKISADQPGCVTNFYYPQLPCRAVQQFPVALCYWQNWTNRLLHIGNLYSCSSRSGYAIPIPKMQCG